MAPWGGVASEGEQILDAELTRLIEAFLDLITSHVGACDVHEDVEAAVLLNVMAEVEGDVTCAASCAPGDVNPEWVRLAHALDSVEQIFDARLSSGREILERVVGFGLALVLVGRGVDLVLDRFDLVADFHCLKEGGRCL